MPVIEISSLELTDEQKMKIAQQFTKTLADVTKCPEERIYCFFKDYPLNGIAVAGKLVSESPPGPDDFDSKYTIELRKKLSQL